MRKSVNVLTLILFLAAAVSFSPAGLAGDAPKPANYPGRPVEIIVPFAAGGGLDVAVRLLGKYAEKELGQRLVVSNKTGGGNIQGNFEGIKARPDGYVLGAWGNGLVTDELIVKGVPYTHKDVQPLCMFANDPEVITIGKSMAEKNNIKTFDDLVKYIKAQPAESVTFGVGGNWTPHDFLRIKMEEMLGVKFNRMPFLGGAPALQSAASGNCDVVVPFLAEVMGMIESGLVVPLAVAYDSRVPQLPNVPAVREVGYPEMISTIWRVFTVPKNTPADIVAYLESVFEKALSNPEFQKTARESGVNPKFMNSKDLSVFIDSEFKYYEVKTKEWGIRIK